MKKKALLVVLAVMALFAVSMPAANAWSSDKRCDNESGFGWGIVTVCVQFDFSKQNDGDGVHLDGVWVDINNGCGDLDANPTDNLKAWAGNKPYDYLNNLVDCHAYRAWSQRGYDTWSTTAYVEVPINVNNANDYTLRYQCVLWDNGASNDCLLQRLP